MELRLELCHFYQNFVGDWFTFSVFLAGMISHRVIHQKPEAVAHKCSVKRLLLEISKNFTLVEKLQASSLLRKRLWHSCFPMNFAKFLRTPFLQNTSGRQFLKVYKSGSEKT